VVQAAHATVVLESMRATLADGRVALYSLPLAIAARPAVLEQIPAGAMLALTGGPWSAPEDLEAMARLREAGARLGGCGMPVESGHFVLLEAADLPLDELERRAQALRHAAPAAQIIATGLPSIDDLETVLKHGIDLAAGAVDRRRASDADLPMSAGVQRICHLLNLLLQDEDLKVLCDDLRTDIDLSYRMLRYANSPLLGLTRVAESVEQAVMLIGRDGLYRWLSCLLMTGAEARPSSRALHEVGLARARLLELLAPQLLAPPSALFTTGLLSMLEVVLRQPLAQALRPLQLPHSATQALLERSGPWAPALEIAQALERDETRTVEVLSELFGGVQAVTVKADAAWSWAAGAVAQIRGN
jgi:EAL and modified HD-GYP domain-containing signal transduction protein